MPVEQSRASTKWNRILLRQSGCVICRFLSPTWRRSMFSKRCNGSTHAIAHSDRSRSRTCHQSHSPRKPADGPSIHGGCSGCRETHLVSDVRRRSALHGRTAITSPRVTAHSCSKLRGITVCGCPAAAQITGCSRSASATGHHQHSRGVQHFAPYTVPCSLLLSA